MEDYRSVRTRDVVNDAPHYRALFSRPRWEEFKGDVAYFRSVIPENDAWRRALRDKGYNATPVWNMVARFITERAPTHNRGAMASLVSLDVLLLALAFASVWHTFRRRTALLSIVFFGTVFMMAYGHVRGAFLRLDWLTLLVMATCMLKAKRYKTAGAMAAYAGMSRVFPLAFVFGLGAKWFWDIVATRKLNSRYLDFFLAFFLVLLVLFALSVVADGGLDSWCAFWAKIRLHDSDISTVRVGFKYVFLMAYKNTLGAWAPYEAGKRQVFHDYQPLWWGIQGVVILISLVAVRRLEDYETIPYGYVLVYFLTAPTFYYHAMLVVPLLLFLPKLDRPSRANGAALLFGVSVAAYAANAFWPLGKLPLSFAQSCMLLLVSFYIMAVSMLNGAAVLPPVSVPGQMEERPV